MLVPTRFMRRVGRGGLDWCEEWAPSMRASETFYPHRLDELIEEACGPVGGTICV